MCFSMLEFSFSSDDSELAAHAADDCAPSAGYCNVICGPSVHSCAAPSFMMTLITSANARTPEECTHQTHKDRRFILQDCIGQQEGVQQTRARIRRKTQDSARSEYARAVSASTKFSTVCSWTGWRRIHTGFKNSSWKSTCSSASDLPKSLGIINSFRSPTEYMSPYCTNILVRIDLFFRWERNTKSRYWMKDSTTKRIWIANLELARRADQLSRAHSQET
jgi:hypothetical protein